MVQLRGQHRLHRGQSGYLDFRQQWFDPDGDNDMNFGTAGVEFLALHVQWLPPERPALERLGTDG